MSPSLIEVPRVALSPIDEAMMTYEDLSSLFSLEMDKPSTITLQSPSAMFSTGNFGDPRPPEAHGTLLLDMFISQLEPEQGMRPQETTPLSTTPSSSEAASPATLECTNKADFVDPLDDPFLNEDYNFSEFLNGVSVVCDPSQPTTICCPSPVENTHQQFELSDCIQLFQTPTLDLSSVTDTELNHLIGNFSTDNSESEPTTPSETLIPFSQPQNTRKRFSSEPDSSPTAKIFKEEKRTTVRRIKNNEASKVSRAKRRVKHTTIFTRETELEDENANMRVQIQEMEEETAKLKKLLVQRLSK